jgi:threonine dehydrogenase-like Zn-dependent dehydrogenase
MSIGRAPSVVRAAVQVAPGALEVHEFERPAIAPDEALLRVEACGLCGTDISQLGGAFHERGLAAMPCIPGHEPLGVIVESGSAAAARWRLQVGDRVAVEPHLSCGSCAACLEGERTVCEVGEHRDTNYGFMDAGAGSGLRGGYAEYLHLDPRTVLHRVAPALSTAVAVMFNPIGAGVRWAQQAPSLRFGDTVAILGTGQRGLACVLAARAAGAGTIIATDLARASAKLELALELGADHVVVADEEDVVERVLELTGGRGVDVVLELTPKATKPVTDAIAMVRRGGTVVLAGVKDMATVPDFVSDELVFRGIRLQGVFTVDSRSYRQAIRLIESDPAVFARFGTQTFSLDRAGEAIARLAGTDGDAPAIHVAIDPWLPSNDKDNQ